MRTKLVLPLLSFILMISLSGCGEDCSNLECIWEPFLFEIVDQQGDNLLDNGTINRAQVAIHAPNNSNDSLPLSLLDQQNGTLLEAYLNPHINQNKDEYVLAIAGYPPFDLKFNLDVRSGECCTSLSIEDVYLNGVPIPKDDGGRRIITLP